MSFATLDLIEPIQRALNELSYTKPTDIQSKTIPSILQGKDILASAPTGTGKTASFVLPLLQRLSTVLRAKNNRITALILTPTRELADQIYQNILQYGKHMNIRSAVVYGGVSINPQMKKLCNGCEILVATPGRLLDLFQQNAVKFDTVNTLILDEADRMLDMGFIHDIKRIIKLMPAKRQNLLFSATFSDEIRKLAKGILNEPVEVDVAHRNSSAVAVKQTVHPVDKARKPDLLSHLIRKNKWEQALVFSRTKHGANRLVKQLEEAQIISAAIHGNKSQSQRMKALADFKSKNIQVLVATDIASRGIDIDSLPCVINFDLPQVPADYVHRIGRTGRAGEKGLAVSLVSADEVDCLNAIEKLINKKIERIDVEDFEPTHMLPAKSIALKAPARTKQHYSDQAKNKTRRRR